MERLGGDTKLIRLKLSFIVVAVIVATMLPVGWLTALDLEREAMKDASRRLVVANAMVHDMIAANQDGLRIALQRLAATFWHQYQGEFSLAPRAPLTAGAKRAPVLLLNGRPIAQDNREVDDFTRDSGGATATVFVRTGDDFLRVASSVPTASGSPATGTFLGKDHPAYAKVMAGQTYLGQARLFGRQYMTEYVPLRDAAHRVVGVLFVGLDLSDSLASLLARARNLKFGSSGYVVVIDAGASGDRGRLLLHPTMQGENIADTAPVRQMLAQRAGIVEYPWRGPNQEAGQPRQRIAAFAEYHDLGWIIATSSEVDELLAVPHKGRNRMILAIALLSLLAMAALYVAVGRWVLRPILLLQNGMARAERTTRSVLDNVQEAVFLHSLDGALIDVNAKMLEMFGVDRDTALRDAFGHRHCYFDGATEQLDAAWERVLGSATASVEGQARRPVDGTTFPVEAVMRKCIIEGEQRVLVSVRDVSARHAYQKQLEHQANYDPLTGLPNRTLLADRLSQEMNAARKERQTVAICFADLDHFKYINDSLGHRIGDELLKAVAARLVASLREHDTVARVGGDEFVIVLPDFNGAVPAVYVLHRIKAEMAKPFGIEGHQLNVTGSIGVSLYPDDASDAETLLRHADIAMYRAKETGRNTIEFFTEEMNGRVQERLHIDMDLRSALERGELFLEYQPQFACDNQRVVGIEALVRWRHPQRGVLAPSEFIAVSEDSGLILPIGQWVLRAACAQAAEWQRAGTPVKIAVNVSARQFQHGEHIARLVGEVLAQTGLAPHLLELEITESMLMRDPPAMIVMLNEIKALGVHLALDDFGTGYSSFSFVKRYPIDLLKIDQSFVKDLTSDPEAAAIVTAIVGMAHALQIATIAEGVESLAQFESLRGIGCDQIQGFHLARPLTAEQIGKLLGATMQVCNC